MGEQLNIEWQERERVLAMLAETRAKLVIEARRVAMELALEREWVCSTHVLRVLRDGPLADELRKVDPRFMGAVFADRSTWVRVGWLSGPESPGSHARPVAMWMLRAKWAAEQRARSAVSASSSENLLIERREC